MDGSTIDEQRLNRLSIIELIVTKKEESPWDTSKLIPGPTAPLT
jgi:hypothetical protein